MSGAVGKRAGQNYMAHATVNWGFRRQVLVRVKIDPQHNVNTYYLC